MQYMCIGKSAFVGSMRQWELRAEPGSSCELSCNPSVCCNEPSGCHGLAAPRLQQPSCGGSPALARALPAHTVGAVRCSC